MEEKPFAHAARALSSDHGLRILSLLKNGRWQIASEVAHTLGIHTSTASKWLYELHRGGFLARRTRKAGTRKAYEYRLGSPHLTLELDLAESETPLEASLIFYTDFVTHAIELARRLGWPGLDKEILARLEAARNDLKEYIFAGIPKDGPLRTVDQLKRLYGQIAAEIRDLCTKTMGEMAASDLVESAYEEASEGKEELVRRFHLNKPLGVA